MNSVKTTPISQISLVCVPTREQDGGNDIDTSHAQFKALGVDVDHGVSRMGNPVPPTFWFRDRSGHTLMVVELKT